MADHEFSISRTTEAAQHPVAFAAAFNSGDPAAVETMYEDDGLLVPVPGHPVTGPDRAAANERFLALGLPIRLRPRHVYTAGDVALLIVDWTIEGTGPDGIGVHIAGTATDVARRGPDGTWRYVIDNPFGVAEPDRAPVASLSGDGDGRNGAAEHLKVRPATVDDLPRVLELVTQMFRDLGTPVTSADWKHAARRRLEAADGVATLVTTDLDDEPIAVAVGVIDERVPSPRRPEGRTGYVEWLATDPRHRRRGAARLAMTALLAWFDAHGIPAVDVHASRDARPLYETLGFQPPAATPLRRGKPGDA